MTSMLETTMSKGIGSLTLGRDRGDPGALLADLGDLGLETQLHAQLVEQPAQAAGDVVQATVHVPQVVPELDVRQAVHERGRAVGRRADVLDEVVEDVAHVACLDVPGHRLVHAAEQVEPGEAPQPVVVAELLRVVQALLEVALVDQVVEAGRVVEEPLEVGRVLADLAQLLRPCGPVSGYRSTTVPSSKKLRQCGRSVRIGK